MKCERQPGSRVLRFSELPTNRLPELEVLVNYTKDDSAAVLDKALVLDGEIIPGIVAAVNGHMPTDTTPVDQLLAEVGTCSLRALDEVCAKYDMDVLSQAAKELSFRAVQAVRFAEYVQSRSFNRPHSYAVRRQNNAAAQVRAILGYSIKRDDITF